MIKGLLVVLLGLVSLQEFVFKQTAEKKGEYQAVSVDDLGNVYLITDRNNILKLSNRLDSLYTYESKSLQVDLVAPQNALKILAFNKNLNSIVFLDKTLSRNSEELSLDQAGLPIVKAIGMSRDNNIWVFDEVHQELKKLDTKLNTVSTSGNLNAMLHSTWFPFVLKEQNGMVYVCDSVKGVLEFDFFGSYLRTIPIQVTGDFKVVNNRLLYVKNDQLIIQDLLLGDQKIIELPVKGIIDFTYSRESILLLTKEKLHIYQLPL